MPKKLAEAKICPKLSTVAPEEDADKQRSHTKFVFDTSAKRLVHIDEFQFRTGIKGRSTVWAKIKAGEIPPPLNLSGPSRWEESVVEQYVESLIAKGSVPKDSAA